MSNYIAIKPLTAETITQDDIEDMAYELGMKIPEDNDFLWIAKEAALEPLPPNWMKYRKKGEEGEAFYFNMKTSQSLWEKPNCEKFIQKFKEEKAKVKKSNDYDNYYSYEEDYYEDSEPSSESVQKKPVSKAKPVVKKERGPNKKLIELKNSHNNEVEEENRVFQERIRKLRIEREDKYDQDLKRIKNDYETSLLQERKNYDNEIQKIHSGTKIEMTESQKAILSQNQNSFDEEKKLLIQTQKNIIESMKSEHQKEMSAMKSEFQAEKSSLEKEITQTMGEIKDKFEKEKEKILKANKLELDDIKKKHSEAPKTSKSKSKRSGKDNLNKELENYKKELEVKKIEIIGEHEKELEKISRRQKGKKKAIVDKLKKEYDEYKKLQNKRLEEAKNMQSDEIIMEELKHKYREKKKRMKIQFQEQISRIEEDNKKSIEEMKKNHDNLIRTLNNEEDEMKQDAELAKKEFISKKKREIKKLNIQLEERIADLSDKYQQRKKQEKAAFQQEIQETLEDMQQKAIDSRSRFSLVTRNEISVKPLSQSDSLTISTQKIYSQKDTSLKWIPQSFNQTYSPDFNQSQSMMGINPLYVNSMMMPTRPPMSDKMIALKLQKGKSKASKYEDQFDSTMENLEGGIKSTQSKVMQAQQSYKKYVNDQNRALSQLAIDFQQQATDLTASLHSTLSEIDNCYRTAIINANKQKNVQIAPPPQPDYKYRRTGSSMRRRRIDIYDDSQEITEI